MRALQPQCRAYRTFRCSKYFRFVPSGYEDFLCLACLCFADLITQGSPSLCISNSLEKRFILANSFAGLVAAGFIAGLVCGVRTEESYSRIGFRAGGKAHYSVDILVDCSHTQMQHTTFGSLQISL